MSTATIPTALTPRQQIIIDLLSEGPRTMLELAVACGYGENDRGGRSYVSVALGRLASRGYGFHNYNPVGSRRGAFYVLMARPHGTATEFVDRTCHACHVTLLNRWNDEGVCWPCQRSRLDVELDMLAPPTLFPVSVAS